MIDYDNKKLHVNMNGNLTNIICNSLSCNLKGREKVTIV